MKTPLGSKMLVNYFIDYPIFHKTVVQGVMLGIGQLVNVCIHYWKITHCLPLWKINAGVYNNRL